MKAKHEVIISAGAFESPKSLELSGIGSSSLLNQYNVDVLYENSNVGENLQDHSLVSLGFEVEDGQVTFDAFNNETYAKAALAQYLKNHTGPLSAGICSSALLSYSQMLPKDEKAKVHKGINHLLTSAQSAAKPGLAHQYQLTQSKVLNPEEATAQQILIESGMTPAEVGQTAK